MSISKITIREGKNALPPVHPGEIIREDILPETGLSVTATAKAPGVSRQMVHEILAGRKPLSAVKCLKVSRLFGSTPEFWMRLQAEHDLKLDPAPQLQIFTLLSPLSPYTQKRERLMFRKYTLVTSFLTIPLLASVMLHDIEGHNLKPLDPSGPANVLFFITNDCPIANSYAPEIQRICSDYAAKGVGCTLVYSDLSLDAAAIRKHFTDYGYKEPIEAVSDASHQLAHATGATITPEAVVVTKGGKVQYRGRIDNFYAALGKPRRFATVHDVRQALDEVLAGKPVSHPQTQALGCYIPQ